jgi:hypothetical protein
VFVYSSFQPFRRERLVTRRFGGYRGSIAVAGHIAGAQGEAIALTFMERSTPDKIINLVQMRRRRQL